MATGLNWSSPEPENKIGKMKMYDKIKYSLFILLMALACSCKTPTERWLDRLPEYKEVHSKDLSFQALKMKTISDTASFYYRVRITPSAKNSPAYSDQVNLYYRMDSAFYLKAGAQTIKPVMVEAVPNGIKGCYEYLLSFDINKKMQSTPVDLVYQDQFIDRKPYTISLNQQ